jgi:hypothetical protein
MSASKKLANEVLHGLGAAAIVFCLGIVALGADFVCWDEPAPPERPASWYEPSRQELEAAHRYHGINFSAQDEITGEWYFIRNGERFRLFAYKR